MKNRWIAFILMLFSFGAYSQLPQKMSYQAVLRDASNNLLINKTVSTRISILQASDTGNAVFVEHQIDQTNDNGLMTLEIGTGTPITGRFDSIDWAGGPYFIKLELDPNGGTNYSISGANELLSVPYAFYAGKSNLEDGIAIGEMKYWNGTTWARLAPPVSLPGTHAKRLTFCNGVPIWGDCPAVPPSISIDLTGVSHDEATANVHITSDGGGKLGTRGLVVSRNPNPTINDLRFNSWSTDTVFSQLLYHALEQSTTYYIRAFAFNEAGVGYSNELNFTTLTARVNDYYLGGHVFYILQPGDLGYDSTATHGLVASPSNTAPADHVWGCNTTHIAAADSQAIGYGLANTLAITNNCISTRTAAYAALHFGDGWYLPSVDELLKLAEYVRTYGQGAPPNICWSSTNTSSNRAYHVSLVTGNRGISLKTDAHGVRPIRAF